MKLARPWARLYVGATTETRGTSAMRAMLAASHRPPTGRAAAGARRGDESRDRICVDSARQFVTMDRVLDQSRSVAAVLARHAEAVQACLRDLDLAAVERIVK